MKFFSRETFAEFLGTFWLVLGGCGAAVFAGSKIGYAGIALAFGLTVFTAAYALGHISGGHFNPAVSFGLWAAGRFESKNLVPYIFAQIIGATLAGFIIWAIQVGNLPQTLSFAVNGYDELSPGRYDFLSAAIVELGLTFMFLIIICGVTDKKAAPGFAPAAIGLALTLIHLIGIPVTNLSVNPARSIGPALVHLAALKELLPLQQLWLFVLAPIGGAMIAGVIYKELLEKKDN